MIFKRIHFQIIPETSRTYLTCSTSTLSLTSHFLALPLSSYHSRLTHKPRFHHRSLHLLSPACNSLCSIRATWLLFTSLNSPKSHPMTGIIFHFIESESKSCSVLSDSLWPHESQHARPPCPSPTPGVYPNSCPLSRWCHPTISSSVVPFSSCLQSFPTSGSFQMSQFSSSGGQSIGVSEHPGLISFRMDCLDLVAVQGTLKSLQHHSSKASILQCSAFFIVQFSYLHMTTGKTIALTRQTLVAK